MEILVRKLALNTLVLNKYSRLSTFNVVLRGSALIVRFVFIVSLKLLSVYFLLFERVWFNLVFIFQVRFVFIVSLKLLCVYLLFFETV